VLPNGPVHHPTVRVFLAGGVPEVMLHLGRLGLLDTRERRSRFRAILREQDGIDPFATLITGVRPQLRPRAVGADQ
jgi:hypothetical protein